MNDMQVKCAVDVFECELGALSPNVRRRWTYLGTTCAALIEPRDFRGNVVSCMTLETFNAYRAWMAEVV